MKNTWNDARENQPAISRDELDAVLRARLRREQSAVTKYFWGSFFYQNLMYAFALNAIIRFWHETQVVILCAGFIVLYVPFTVLLLKRYKAMHTPRAHASQHVQQYVSHQHAVLQRFFRFKQRFEWAAIPLSSLFIVGVIFELYVDGGVQHHLAAAALVYGLVLTAFVTAVVLENKKRFIEPLRQLEMIRQEMAMTETASH
ncbi:MAG: hypothetical protein HC859_04335 [Bacteroidia bacterium]|nr:hypothetical protein [Bacteroidia bacterium]